MCWLAVGGALGEYGQTNPNDLGLWASHLKPMAQMSEVPTRIRVPKAPVLEISINSYDTPENELIEPST